MKRCGTCIHLAPGKFYGNDSPGVQGDVIFHGCEYLESFCGVQDRTPGCVNWQPAECPAVSSKPSD